MIKELKKKVQATLKSSETEDWLDYRVVRPLSYLWALLFAKLDIHPNTVTIISMIIGAASCVFFMHGSFYYEGWQGLLMNIIGVLLLCQADIFDCTDGQLARMTGKKSRLGRILDGMAGFVWFVPIYVLLMVRFYNHHSLEFGWLGIPDTEQNAIIATIVVVCLALYSGFVGMGGQQRLADYYIQVHLFLLKGEKGSELDNSALEALPQDLHQLHTQTRKGDTRVSETDDRAAREVWQCRQHARPDSRGTAPRVEGSDAAQCDAHLQLPLRHVLPVLPHRPARLQLPLRDSLHGAPHMLY